MGEIAERLGAPVERVERVLAVIHTFDPGGVGARDLSECLAIQLRERDRFDPAMQALVAHLPLLAKRDFTQLRKICGVDDRSCGILATVVQTPSEGRSWLRRAFDAECFLGTGPRWGWLRRLPFGLLRRRPWQGPTTVSSWP